MSVWARLMGNVVKWWQQTIMPVFHLDNNYTNQQITPEQMQQQQMMQQQMMQQQMMQQQMQNGQVMGGVPNASQPVQPQQMQVTQQVPPVQSQTAQQTTTPEMNGGTKAATQDPNDAQAILDRINREKEEKRLQDMNMAQAKAEEQARLDAIMNANKVDVNSFIQEGKAASHEESEKQNKVAEDDAAARAAEIFARLQAEEAEDLAKKQAEIEAAKQQAAENFGK